MSVRLQAERKMRFATGQYQPLPWRLRCWSRPVARLEAADPPAAARPALTLLPAQQPPLVAVL